jgi:hypothetical protein
MQVQTESVVLNHVVRWIPSITSVASVPIHSRVQVWDRFTASEATVQATILNRLFADSTGYYDVRRVS